MKTKICCVSDLHGQLPQLPESDILLICGDISPTYNHQVWFQEQWFNGTFIPWLIKQPAQRKVFIAGNHDFFLEKALATKEKLMKPDSIMYLKDTGVEINGLKIWGTPWQREYGWIIGELGERRRWAFNLTESQLAEKWQLIHEDTDILVTHSPPFYFGDTTIDYNEKKVVNAGSTTLLSRLEKLEKLKLHCFGHIHSGYGRYKTIRCNAELINCALLDEDYKLTNEPIMVEI